MEESHYDESMQKFERALKCALAQILPHVITVPASCTLKLKAKLFHCKHVKAIQSVCDSGLRLGKSHNRLHPVLYEQLQWAHEE